MRILTDITTIFPQDFPTRISHKIFLQDFPARISHKIFPQDFPTRISCKIFPQDFPTRFSLKIFPQDFPELDPDWLAPHHPIPKAKFPPITALLNRPTYHKKFQGVPTTLSPNLMGTPKSMNKLTLNEPAASWVMKPGWIFLGLGFYIWQEVSQSQTVKRVWISHNRRDVTKEMVMKCC